MATVSRPGVLAASPRVVRADGLLVVEPRWAENDGQLANCYRLARAK